MMQMWTPPLQPGPLQGSQMQALQAQGLNADQARRCGRKLASSAKSHPPPDGFYCYYPEIFEKPYTTIFQVVKVQRPSLKTVSDRPVRQDIESPNNDEGVKNADGKYQAGLAVTGQE